jgi:urea transport system permease protein
MMNTYLRLWLALLGGAFLIGTAAAQDDAAVRDKLCRALAADGAEQRQLVAGLADTGSRVASDILNAWTHDSVYWYEANGSKAPVLLEDQTDANGKARAIRVADGKILTDAAGKELRFTTSDLNSVDTDSALRSVIQQTLDTLIQKLGNSQKLKYIPILQDRLGKEADASVRRTISEAIAMLQLGSPDTQTQLAAANQLAALKAIGSLETLQKLSTSKGSPPEVVQAAKRAVNTIGSHINTVNVFGTLFRGISGGSILLIVALGLAITFGLMGIINMAHGEMIAIGAYTCYVMQNLFGSGFAFSINLPFHFFGHPMGFGLSLPGMNASGWLYESYFLFALPLSFLTAALAGLILERTVIRFLYRRPLESLLATWGVSLVMQQLFRMVFGANNVQVSSPRWLLGHFTIDDVSLGYNRVFVIVFAVLIVFGTWLLLTKTPLGLLIRAVMQNRDMASCMGVRTARVNMLTFAFGSGLAGLAGAFLSQIGNVGPSLGQSYIVDSFMTVVVGGVGSIVGTIYSAVGIGTSDQVLQQVTGSPVTGKIVVLITIILFLQWKPGGLFSIRSRSLD